MLHLYYTLRVSYVRTYVAVLYMCVCTALSVYSLDMIYIQKCIFPSGSLLEGSLTHKTNQIKTKQNKTKIIYPRFFLRIKKLLSPIME
jgi:hypothetical protein